MQCPLHLSNNLREVGKAWGGIYGKKGKNPTDYSFNLSVGFEQHDTAYITYGHHWADLSFDL